MKEQAEFYRVGLLLGLFKISDVIAWCDAIIMAEAAPDLAIIEASMSGSKGVNAVANALSEVNGDYDERLITKRIFRAMYEFVNQNRKQASRVAYWLYDMAADVEAQHEEVEPSMWYFYDALDLAADGIYGDAEDLTDELLQFLRKKSELES